jgi:hypothetical protein
MNIISCGNYGVVIDTGGITKPDMEDEECCIDTNKAAWIDHEYKPTIHCPVCSKRMLFESGNSV